MQTHVIAFVFIHRNADSRPSSLDVGQLRLRTLDALRCVHLLESRMPRFADDVTLALKLSRLYCVFLAGKYPRLCLCHENFNILSFFDR